MTDPRSPLALPCPECARPTGAYCITTNTARRCNTHKARIAEAKAENLRHALGLPGLLRTATPRALVLLRQLAPDATLRRGVDGVYRHALTPLPPPVTAELRRLGLIREACGQQGHFAVLTALGRDLVLELHRPDDAQEVAAHG